jgi:hypothetical protein
MEIGLHVLTSRDGTCVSGDVLSAEADWSREAKALMVHEDSVP